MSELPPLPSPVFAIRDPCRFVWDWLRPRSDLGDEDPVDTLQPEYVAYLLILGTVKSAMVSLSMCLLVTY